LPTNLLSIPVLAWVGGSLLSVRLLVALASHVPVPAHHFGRVVRGVSGRSLRRRAADLAGGILGLGLIVAFGTGLALFAATYDAAKDADTRFTLGSDIRITPSVLATDRPGADDASAFLVRGVAAVSPVVFEVENAVMIGRHNQQRENLAAIDPSTFSAVAPLPDQVFVEGTAADALAALAADPRGVLVDEGTADDLTVDVGDRVGIILALGTKREIQDRFRVAGLFERFPGMSEGANLVANLDRYRAVTGIRQVDFFLARVEDDSRGRGERDRFALVRSGPSCSDPHRFHRDDAREGPVEPDRHQRQRARSTRYVLRPRDERHRDRDLRVRSPPASPRGVRRPAGARHGVA
jgi:hypothetical protein